MFVSGGAASKTDPPAKLARGFFSTATRLTPRHGARPAKDQMGMAYVRLRRRDGTAIQVSDSVAHRMVPGTGSRSAVRFLTAEVPHWPSVRTKRASYGRFACVPKAGSRSCQGAVPPARRCRGRAAGSTLFAAPRTSDQESGHSLGFDDKIARRSRTAAERLRLAPALIASVRETPASRILFHSIASDGVVTERSAREVSYMEPTSMFSHSQPALDPLSVGRAGVREGRSAVGNRATLSAMHTVSKFEGRGDYVYPTRPERAHDPVRSRAEQGRTASAKQVRLGECCWALGRAVVHGPRTPWIRGASSADSAVLLWCARRGPSSRAPCSSDAR